MVLITDSQKDAFSASIWQDTAVWLHKIPHWLHILNKQDQSQYAVPVQYHNCRTGLILSPYYKSDTTLLQACQLEPFHIAHNKLQEKSFRIQTHYHIAFCETPSQIPYELYPWSWYTDHS